MLVVNVRETSKKDATLFSAIQLLLRFSMFLHTKKLFVICPSRGVFSPAFCPRPFCQDLRWSSISSILPIFCKSLGVVDYMLYTSLYDIQGQSRMSCTAFQFRSSVISTGCDRGACLAIKCVLRRVVENATTWPTSNLPSGNVT